MLAPGLRRRSQPDSSRFGSLDSYSSSSHWSLSSVVRLTSYPYHAAERPKEIPVSRRSVCAAAHAGEYAASSGVDVHCQASHGEPNQPLSPEAHVQRRPAIRFAVHLGGARVEYCVYCCFSIHSVKSRTRRWSEPRLCLEVVALMCAVALLGCSGLVSCSLDPLWKE